MDYFEAIVSQEKALQLLKKSIANKSISHAYLFHGPEGVGKMLTARAFAYSIISSSDQQGQAYLREGVHPDLLVLEKEPEKTMLGKDLISKTMQPWLALKPYRAKNRVVIIRDAHLMSQEAENALLKSLEEPPHYAVIILIADDDNLLETIVSRCQMVSFLPVPEAVIEQFLRERGIEAEKAYRASRMGRESIGKALKFGAEEGFFENWITAMEIIKGLGTGKVIEVFTAAEKMGKAPDLISSILLTILRDLYILSETGHKQFLIMPENGEEYMALNKKADKKKLREAIPRINDLQRNYSRNVNPLITNINIAYEINEVFK